jgi:membrane-bound lytic murein transglycosylase B
MLPQRIIPFFVGFLNLFAWTGFSARAAEPAFDRLAQRLMLDGGDSLYLASLFGDERVSFIPTLVKFNLAPREVSDAYRHFLTEEQVKDGAKFLNRWRPLIQQGLQGTQVSPAMAVAILKVESDLGRKSGKYSTFNSLATMTLLEDSLHWVAKYDTSGGADLERLNRRAVRRAGWAYAELKHYLNLCRIQGWDPLELRGSWAGAFGWAQFVPSSYLRCARDGDGDGRVDPFSLRDALASMACYLDEAGWRFDPTTHRRALLLYNSSDAYVDCILEYADRLAQTERNGATAPAEEFFGN